MPTKSHDEDIIISNDVRELVKDFCEDFVIQLGNPSSDLSVNIESVLDIKQRQQLLRDVELALHCDLRTLDILEIGAGVGLFTVLCKKMGLSIRGVEPAANTYSNSVRARHKLLKDNDLPIDTIADSIGETLPFEDAQFDLVLSFNVLEHVSKPEQVLREAYRVLRPGGLVYFRMPSYNTFYEGHYGIPWLPWLTKRTAKPYVNLWGRNPLFLDELYFVRPGFVKKIAQKVGFEVKAIFPTTQNKVSDYTGLIPEPVNTESNIARAPGWLRALWKIAQLPLPQNVLKQLQIYPVITLIAYKNQ
jgi:SAM-dependent methyltransferase